MTEESPGPPKVKFNDNAIEDKEHDCLGYWEQSTPLPSPKPLELVPRN